MNENNLQRSHYNKLAKAYEYHYSDELTKKYRHEIFLFDSNKKIICKLF